MVSSVSPMSAPIICVVGARPNFIKMAPILRAMAAHSPQLPFMLVHTGQHYAASMSDNLFADLELPEPDINLAVGSDTHAVQTAEVMRKFEPVIDAHSPSCVMVVGDVNSTLACALVASKKAVPVAHVESGLRSNDRSMPEEINRVLTDQLCDRLYTTERSAALNLVREGIAEDKIRFVGNVMIDSLIACRGKATDPATILRLRGANPNILNGAHGFGVVTLHRPSNVDCKNSLEGLLEVMNDITRRIPLVFVLHPRTQNAIDRFRLGSVLDSNRCIVLPPQGYLEMLGLMSAAAFVLTDSGGLQEETTALGVPCLTARENTERPITVEEGTNTLVGTRRETVLTAVEQILNGRSKRGRTPELWDGQSAKRIAEDLYRWLSVRKYESNAISENGAL